MHFTFGFSVQITGIFRAVPVRLNPRTRQIRSVYRTYIDVIHFRREKNFTDHRDNEDWNFNDDEESRFHGRDSQLE